MNTQDTIQLLKECDAGTKMAVASMDEVLKNLTDPKLRELFAESKEHHASLGNDLHELLLQYDSQEQEPNPIAKGMSWMKTNVKMGLDATSQTAAELITSGCDMGINSLYKYLNQYPAASQDAKDICHRLISIEETLRDDLREYL